MTACFVATLLAAACVAFTGGLILPGPAGAKVRRWSFGLFAAAFIPGVVAALIRDAWASMTRSPAAFVSGIVALTILSIAAFAILELRRFLTPSHGSKAKRILEKKPVAPRTASDDVVSFLRDRLRSDEPEGRDE